MCCCLWAGITKNLDEDKCLVGVVFSCTISNDGFNNEFSIPVGPCQDSNFSECFFYYSFLNHNRKVKQVVLRNSCWSMPLFS